MRILRSWKSEDSGIIKRLEDVSEMDISRMDSLKDEYLRTIKWPSEKFEMDHPEVKSLSPIEQMWKWEDWVCKQISRSFAAQGGRHESR